MKYLYLLTFFYFIQLKSQSPYFPPINNSTWDTISPNRLGWCEDSIQSLYNFLEQKNTKSFIVLKDGKIVIEKYFGTYTKDSLWYWASAGKTLTSALVGVAHSEKILRIQDSTSKYLGVGWTSCTPQQEGKIKIIHQLTMSTGLDEDVPDENCIAPACLKYKAQPNTRWYYHNAPYRLLQDVVANASGTTFQLYTRNKIGNKIGMSGLWYDYIYYSKARDMARFGLLASNKFIWNNDTIIKDRNYVINSVNTSQSMNYSYGYLWWLNGKSSFMAPSTSIVFNGMLTPKAPADMYSALGKNDQKIYIVPSQKLVVIRQGNDAGQATLGPSSFDNDVWDRMSRLACNKTSIEHFVHHQTRVLTNPFTNKIELELNSNEMVLMYNSLGLEIYKGTNIHEQDFSYLNSGIYHVIIYNTHTGSKEFFKQVKY